MVTIVSALPCSFTTPRLAGLNALIAAAYVLLGLAVAHYFAAFGLFPAPIWLPASIALTAALLLGPSAAPGIFVGSFLVNFLLFNPPAWVAAVISLGNAFGPVVGARLMRRFAAPTEAFITLRGLAAFVGCAVLLHAAIVGSIGAVTLAVHEDLGADGLLSIGVTWFLSDAGGMLYLAPTLLLWVSGDQLQAMHRNTLAEGAAVSVATVMVAVLLFTGFGQRGPLMTATPYLLALPIAWVTVRWSLRSAATLFTLIAVIATAGTMAGSGPFNMPGIDTPLAGLGTMVVLCGINMLLISALVQERRSAMAGLSEANRSLEQRIVERTRELEKSRTAAEAASQAKSRFLAAMTHEFRTPLNAIIGFADAIRLGIYGAPSAPRYQEAVGLIESSGRHLLALVDSLLDAAKMEAGTFSVTRERIDLDTIAQETVAMVAPLAAERRVTVERFAGSEVPAVVGDGRAMQQVLLNLLSNAIKFTETGGRVTLVHRVPVEPGAARRAELEVRDTGVGMTAEEITVALQPFGRVNNSLTRADRGGTGLGLPLAKAMTEAQGGAFTITSHPGEGTRIVLSFPAVS
jgi:signal transduction histidine kinase